MTTFPEQFLWGAATAGHQIEGNNVNSDWWARERQMPGMELSGDACDSYHRYAEDMQLLADAGLTSYRFSLEWSRIEPVRGHFSRAELAHYRRVIDACLDRGITPVVTLQHFTTPQWFAEAGGWSGPDAKELFVRYVERASTILDGVEWVATMNEPNMQAAMMTAMERIEQSGGQWQSPTVEGEYASDEEREQAARNNFLASADPAISRAFVEIHPAARDVVRDQTDAKVGWTVAAGALTAAPAARRSSSRSATARRTSSGRAAAATTGPASRRTRASRSTRTGSSRTRSFPTTRSSAPPSGPTRSRWRCGTRRR